MSVGTKLLQAAAGNAGETVYVDDVFSTDIWDGNGGTQSIVNGIDLSGEGGLTWIKYRDQSLSHHLTDTARGTNSQLSSDSTGAAGASTVRVTAFNNNGFTLGANTGVNGSTGTYVGWTFRKQRKFFDIVTYTGNGTAGRTISHNLGSVPGMMIVKSISNGESWEVYHRKADATAPEDKYLQLNGTGSVGDSSFRWNDTAPTATEFTVGGANEVNGNGMTYVAYLFAHNEQDFGENSDEAIIYCDSFVNNSASVGVEVNVGFEPQWLLIKGASSDSGLGAWLIIDNMRNAILKTNNSNAEYANDAFEFTSRGFKPLTYYDGTLIYVAIARPHKPASEFAATDLFEPVEYTGNGVTGRQIGSTVSPDSYIMTSTNTEDTLYPMWGSKLQGNSTRLTTSSNATEYSSASYNYSFGEFQKGIYARGSDVNGSGENYITYLLRRAKGFFDVVAYTGNGVAGRTLPHNLGVTPEIIIFKNRTNNNRWTAWFSSFGTDEYIFLDGNAFKNNFGIGTGDYYLNDTAPTSSVITLGSDTNVNSSSAYKYLAYLFASANGISKVGTYTGTGSDVNVDCGFSAGARFVLIKRTDASSSDWYVYDSVRGIVAGNDPYFFLNDDANQVTNTDYIDPLNAGFTVTSSAPAALNNSGGNYIFLAIA